MERLKLDWVRGMAHPKTINPHACILVAILAVALASIPLLTVSTNFHDDWAWIWVHHYQGVKGLQEYMWQAAHPGFGPVYDLLFWLNGAAPGIPGRIIAVTCHLASSWTIWLIFLRGRATAVFAANVAVLYAVAPFLGGLRASYAHTVYDVFVMFYLGSIVLCDRKNVLVQILAIALALAAMSIETLAALEPIRWWYLYRRGYGVKGTVRRAAPYLIVIGIVFVSRVTWLTSYGIYEGLNTPAKIGVREVIANAFDHVGFFFSSLQSLRLVGAFIVYENPLIVALFLALAGAIAVARYRLSEEPADHDLAILAVVGLAVLGAGILPYAALRRIPDWTNFFARLAVTSQFGMLILVAVCIQMLRGRTARAAVVGIAAFLFTALQFQFGKWALYEEAILRDFRTAIAQYVAKNPPHLIVANFDPPSTDIFYLKRCLASYEMNVELDVSGQRHGSFVIDQACYPPGYIDKMQCGVTSFELTQCPALRATAEYRVRPGIERFTRVRFLELLQAKLSGAPINTGTLEIRETGRISSRSLDGGLGSPEFAGIPARILKLAATIR